MFRDGLEGVVTGHGIRRLPSAPVTAQRVVAVAERPVISIGELVRVVRGDPATVLALLRAVGNRHRWHDRCTSVHAAIERLGMRRAMRICLRFRLLDRHAAGGVDYIRQWRQALLMTAYARAIARRLRRADWACIQTAAALHAIGPITDSGIRPQSTSAGSRTAEWLAAQGVSRALCELVGASHRELPGHHNLDVAAACIVLAGSMADVWLRADWELTATQTKILAQRLFGAIPDLCAWVFGVLGPQATELETLLQIGYPTRRKMVEIYQSARRLRSAC